jgi:small subunit ribosomal protein S1
MTANLPPTKPPAEVHPMQALLEQGGYDMPQRGDIREGTVLSVGPNEIIIDLGLKREGIVPGNDLARLDKDTLAEIKEGTTWPVYILQPSDREGNLIVSLSRAMQEKDWIDAQKMMEASELFETKVTGYNAGGLEVPFGKLRGFVPASHISSLPRNATPEERKERLAAFVGRTIPLKVVEVDRRRRRLIMSERAARRRWQREHRKQLLDEIEVGEVREGVVRSLSDFGAFIDLGGADGLVHISELAWFPVGHPSEVVRVGQEVEVKVLRIDKQRERIGLSIKRVQPDPWSRVQEDYRIGELVEAVVTRVVDFGAFVRLKTGVEGLLHVSEMADITPDHPQSLVAPGDLLLLRVLRIEPERRRVGLSLRQVSEQEWAEWAAQYHQRQPAEAQSDIEGEVPPASDEPLGEADYEMAPDAEGEPVSEETFDVGPNGELVDEVVTLEPSGEVVDEVVTLEPSGEVIDEVVTLEPSGEVIDEVVTLEPSGEVVDEVVTLEPSGELVDDTVVIEPDDTTVEDVTVVEPDGEEFEVLVVEAEDDDTTGEPEESAA